jgi:hypothetical protein
MFPLSPTIFGIYIGNLEDYLEEVGCARMKMEGLIIILLLYANDVVLLTKRTFDLDKQHKIVEDFCTNFGMYINTNKTNVIIIKFKLIMYPNFVYDNNLEEVHSYNILELIFITS